MNLNLAIPLALHQLAALVWIGGMFFAHFALRPTLKQGLEPPARIQVAMGVFSRFFPWVWVCIATLWLTGLWIGIAEFQGRVGLHVHVMAGVALAMTLVFSYLYAFPYRKMRTAVGYENWRWASAKFSVIRKLMAMNLALGLLTAVVGVSGSLVLPGLQALLTHPSGTAAPAQGGAEPAPRP
jgi:uncharacterized membrane protein